MLKQSLPVEKRQFGRRQSGSHGWVKIRGRPALPCVVRNISEGGALLEFQAAEMLPFRFRIVIESERIDCDCETRHQNGNHVGVQFVKEERRAAASSLLNVDDVSSWTSRGRR